MHVDIHYVSHRKCLLKKLNERKNAFHPKTMAWELLWEEVLCMSPQHRKENSPHVFTEPSVPDRRRSQAFIYFKSPFVATGKSVKLKKSWILCSDIRSFSDLQFSSFTQCWNDAICLLTFSFSLLCMCGETQWQVFSLSDLLAFF